MTDPAIVERWLAALERRHLSELTHAEVARALRALSSCYVERRGRLAAGGALATAGKRAAFALFYGSVHFFVIQHVVRHLPGEARQVARITDLGCGTGAAGAAWALETGTRSIDGRDRHPWAVAEANWTYRELRLRGRAFQENLDRGPVRGEAGSGILAAYVVNELSEQARDRVLAQLAAVRERGARVLIVEPIARRLAPWWEGWAGTVTAHGGRADTWRFPAVLPPLQRALARAAGLDPQELTARSLWW